MDKVTGGAFGTGIEGNIRRLYRSIVYNYEEGDELYFFGYSRGAFTVRSLNGFMNLVGLVEKDDDYFVPDIYRCYEKNKREGSKEWEHAYRKIRDPRDCPPIKFVGVWDTVGSLGAPGVIGKVASALSGNKYAYHEVGLNDHIENAYHALAIDERREPFLPTLYARPAGWSGTLRQAWFPGVHSNVGGGVRPDGLANGALHWIVSKAEGCGLQFDHDYLKFFEPHFDSKLHDSMSLKYRLFGSGVRAIGEHIDHGECIHDSATKRREDKKQAYSPENLPDPPARIPIVSTDGQ
jgi:uncharacterized protein (DUF2235 family)